MKNVLKRVWRRIDESAEIARFGSTLVEVVRLFCVLVKRNNTTCYPLTGSFTRKGTQFSLTFVSHGELMLFHEIFSRNEYLLPKRIDAEYVVDLGANRGITSVYLHTEFPKARIAAVEPNPALFQKLQDTCAPFPLITPFQVAVSGTDGEMVLHIDPNLPLSASLKEREENTQAVSVRTVTLDTLQTMAEFPRIDMLKFDIEGAEWDACTTYSKRYEVRALAGEIHEDLMGATLSDFLALWPTMEIVSVPTKKKGRYVIHGIKS